MVFPAFKYFSASLELFLIAETMDIREMSAQMEFVIENLESELDLMRKSWFLAIIDL